MRAPTWLHPLLFAVYPVLFLFQHNVREMPVIWWEVALPAVLGVAGAAALLVAGRFVLGNAAKAGLAASLTLLLFYGYGHACHAAAGTRLGPLALDSHGFLLPLWLLLWGAGLWGISRARGELAGPTTAANVAASVLVGLTLLQLAPLAFADPGRAAARTEALPEGVAPEQLPDIYYLVFDAYTRQDVLEEVFEYDNTGFLEDLEERGFYVARESRANYPRTATSFAATFDYEMLDRIVDRYGRDHKAVRIFSRILNGSRLLETLRHFGYTLVKFRSGYWVTEDLEVDVVLGPEDSALSAGTFLDLLLNTTLARPLLQSQTDSAYESHRRRTRHVFETLPTVADGRSPVFCLAHVIGPHPPFVFRADGGPRRPDMPYGLADHTTFFDRGGTAAAYVSGYTEQVAFLNRRILHMIDRLLARPGPAPIIIIQGDHGSRFITEDPGSPRFLAEKLAILNAYYLPGGGNELLYPSITPVNSFRIVLSHYFGMNLPLLPDRVFWAPSDSPLQLTDVTDETGPESVAGGQ